jgi:hypothetical protein
MQVAMPLNGSVVWLKPDSIEAPASFQLGVPTVTFLLINLEDSCTILGSVVSAE